MKYPNSPFLREALIKSGWNESAASAATLVIDDLEFQEELEMLRKHKADEATIRDKAAFRLLNPPVKVDGLSGSLADLKAQSFRIRSDIKRSRKESWIRFGITAALLVGLILLSAIRGYSQQANVNPTITISSCAGVTVTAGARTALTTNTTGELCADVTGSTVTAMWNSANPGVTISGQPISVYGSTNGTPVTVSFQTANIAANLAQVNGVTTSVGSGTSNTGTIRVAIADADACAPGSGYTKTVTAISVTTSSQLVTGATGQFLTVCAVSVWPMPTATNVAFVSGTGTVCATGIAGVFGGTTAATGGNFAANGGIAFGNGLGLIGRGASGGNICVILSAANQISGSITTVLSP